jgi:polyisoprenyl-phosphate glycosyltransferase
MIWIFSPVYFDVKSYKKLIENINEVANKNNWGDIKFICVDDTAGIDPEIEELKSHDNLDVLTLPVNMGHQLALVYALREYKNIIQDEDAVFTLDADGEDRPEDLPRLFETLQNQTFKDGCILAKRTSREEDTWFKLNYVFFKVLFKVLTGTVIQSGNFACFKGYYLQTMILHPNFDLCYSSSLVRLNPNKISYVPCPRGIRYEEQSKMNYKRLILHGLRMLMPFIDLICMRGFIGICITYATTLTFLVIMLMENVFSVASLPYMNAILISAIGSSTFLFIFIVMVIFIFLSKSNITHPKYQKN